MVLALISIATVSVLGAAKLKTSKATVIGGTSIKATSNCVGSCSAERAVHCNVERVNCSSCG